MRTKRRVYCEAVVVLSSNNLRLEVAGRTATPVCATSRPVTASQTELVPVKAVPTLTNTSVPGEIS
jgi:hypothetical protein